MLHAILIVNKSDGCIQGDVALFTCKLMHVQFKAGYKIALDYLKRFHYDPNIKIENFLSKFICI